jgi:hypothetical protein
MLKKKIKYTDIFDGSEKEEDFYFNLTKAEAAELESSIHNGWAEYMSAAVATHNAEQIVAGLKSVILKAYGEKSLDGKRFLKSKEISEAFATTEAYSVLFLELAENKDAASAFVQGIMPQVVLKEA